MTPTPTRDTNLRHHAGQDRKGRAAISTAQNQEGRPHLPLGEMDVIAGECRDEDGILLDPMQVAAETPAGCPVCECVIDDDGWDGTGFCCKECHDIAREPDADSILEGE